jgi:hypothetical protein
LIIKNGPIDLTQWLELHAWVAPRDVRRGEEGYFVLEVKIPPNGHIQSHQITDPFLVAAELMLDPADGITFGNVQYPPPSEEKVFDWVWMKRVLSVYTGTIRLVVPFTVATAAARGTKKLRARLNYQGCTVADCLPPNTQMIEDEISIIV